MFTRQQQQQREGQQGRRVAGGTAPTTSRSSSGTARLCPGGGCGTPSALAGPPGWEGLPGGPPVEHSAIRRSLRILNLPVPPGGVDEDEEMGETHPPPGWGGGPWSEYPDG